jgi:predicted outer membrane protein
MSNRSLILSTSLALALVGTACDRRDTPVDEPTTTPSPTNEADMAPAPDPTAAVQGDAPTATTAATTDDSLALGLLGAINQHEIDAAQQAKSKQVSAPVLAYANMMEQQHGENLAKTRQLGTLASTPEVQSMQEKGKSDLAELGKRSGKEYETAYVDAMVKGHTEALALIDGRLLSLASAGPVKDHLTETRGHVATHLEEAKKLQAR